MKQLTAILILLFSSAVYASNPHHDHYDGGGSVTNITEVTEVTNITNVTEVTEVTNTTEVTNISKGEDAEGVALSIAAAQCQFDFGTYRLQGCISTGQYEETKAINFAAAKRFEDNRALFTGSVGFENGKAGIGAALIWRF